MRWPRLVTSLVFLGGLVLTPAPAAPQAQCPPDRVAPVGTIELKSQQSGPVHGDDGPVIPITAYEFKVERAVDGRHAAVDAKRYAPLAFSRPVDAASEALRNAAENDEDLTQVVLTADGRDGEPLLTYRFGLARVVSQTSSTVASCAVEEVRLRVGIVHITHEPSGASVVDSGAVDF